MMSFRIPLPLVLLTISTIAAVALVLLLSALGVGAQDDTPLATLPDDVTLVRVWELCGWNCQALKMDDEDAALLLDNVRSAPLVSVVRANADYWEVLQEDVWRPFATQYTHSMDFGDYHVWLAPAPGGTLVIVSQPRPAARVYGDWHGQPAYVVDGVGE